MPRLSSRPRRLVRAAHVAASGGWLGLVVAMLVLEVSVAVATDGAFANVSYRLMGRIRTHPIPLTGQAV